MNARDEGVLLARLDQIPDRDHIQYSWPWCWVINGVLAGNFQGSYESEFFWGGRYDTNCAMYITVIPYSMA